MFWPTRLLSILLALVFCFGLEALAMKGGDLTVRLVMFAGLYVTLSVSLNLINGITGQFSIGHAAFWMTGAYTAGIVSNSFIGKLGLPASVSLALLVLCGAAGAAIAGFVVGMPSLRLKGDYLAVVTMGFGEILRILVQSQQSIGGSYGMNIAPKIKMVWMVWLLAILCIAVCRNLLKTAHGLPFLAVREDEIASSAMGVNVTRVKVTAFVIGSAFAGAAGALLGSSEAFISPDMFKMDISFIILTMVVLGGTGSITGSALAGAALFYIPELLRDMAPVQGNGLLAGAVAVVSVVIALKWLSDHYHGPKWNKAGFMVGAVVGAVVLQFLLSLVLKGVPSLAAVQIEAQKLRMVIFAVTLIVLMLLRPQGVFAHHEFSWTWVKKLLGMKGPEPAVNA